MVSLPNHLGTSVAQLPGGEIVEPSGLRSVEMGASASSANGWG